MEFLIIAAIVVGGFYMLPSFADEKTKLLRRVWSSERSMAGSVVLQGTYGELWKAQDVAINALMVRYGISANASQEDLLEPIRSLMADAIKFDVRYPVNAGIEVTMVLLRELRKRCPNMSGPEPVG